jgi:hypothetical protein
MGEFNHEDLLQWYRARDLFLGLNFSGDGSWREAKTVASKSNHPDAKWLVSWIGDREKLSDHDAIELILHSENTSRSKTFAGYLDRMMMNWSVEGEPNVTEAANDNYPLACGLLANSIRHVDTRLFLRYAKTGAEGEDPQSLYLMGVEMHFSENNEEGKKLVLKAAKLGWVKAQRYYAKYFCDEESEERYVWLIKSYKNGYPLGKFFTKIAASFKNYTSSWKLTNPFSQDSLKRQTFAIGKVLSIESDKGSFNRPFGGKAIGAKEMEIIDTYVKLYSEVCQEARDALILWTLHCKTNLRGIVPKDIRRMIAVCIWNNRISWMK